MSGRSAAAVSLLLVSLAPVAVRAQSEWFPRPGAGPAARAQHAAALDRARNEVLLFGGAVQGQLDGETWTWNGTSWLQRVVPGPTPRSGSALAPYRDIGVLLFGGLTREGPTNETWLWNGSAWFAWSSLGVSARHGHALAESPQTGSAERSVLLYGGLVQGLPTEETYRWTGGGWLLLTSGGLPGRRHAHAMAYDAVRNVTVMFGGLTVGGQLAVNDTWAWDGFGWAIRTNGAQPPARHGHAMAVEPVSGRVVMFGGQTASGPANDVWEWDGNIWHRRLPATLPSARTGHAMATDPVRGRVFLAGGSDATGERADTWAYGPLHLADVTSFGRGCIAALSPVPALALPWIGSPYQVRVDYVIPFQAVFLLFGASDTTFGSLTLPFDLAPLGMPRCSLYCSMDHVDMQVSLNSWVGAVYVVPNSPSLVGATFYQQALAVDRFANPFGMSASNGLRFVIGAH